MARRAVRDCAIAAAVCGLLASACGDDASDDSADVDAGAVDTDDDDDDETDTDDVPDASGFVVTPFADAEFVPAAPGVPDGPAVAFLWGDPATGPVAYLLRISPGGGVGPHTHSSRYDAISLGPGWRHWLAGEAEEDIVTHPAFTYVSQPAGQVHTDECEGPDDCFFFLYMPEVFDFMPAPDPDPVEDVGEYRVIEPDDRTFVPAIPDLPEGPQVAIASGDPDAGPVAYFLELPPGWQSGMHTHTSDYHAITLGADSRHWLLGEDESDAAPLDALTYWYQPSTVPHDDACDGSEACLAFLVMPGPIDIVPHEQ